MGMSDTMLPSRYDSYRVSFYEASKDPPVEAINRKECGYNLGILKARTIYKHSKTYSQ